MSDQSSTTTDQTGITRAADGTIQEPGSNQNTNQGQTAGQEQQAGSEKTGENTTKSDGTSLLNKKDGDDKPTGAPEKYEDFKVPDGLKVNPEKMTAATTLFKELGLPQDGAQKLVDLYAKELTEAAEAPLNAYLDQRKEWQKAVMADPEIGGKLKEVRTTISRAIDTLGGPLAKEFREAMDLTGAGDHPAFIKAFFKFGSQLTEGRHVNGGGPSIHGQARPGNASGPGAAAMYPGLPSSNR